MSWLRAPPPSLTLPLKGGGDQIWMLLPAVAILLRLYWLLPEATIRAPMVHDGIMHLPALQAALDALRAGHDPTDVWFPPVSMGYPLFHTYQHLPYVLPAIVVFGLQSVFGSIPLDAVLGWTTYLLLCFFPASIYWSARQFGFDRPVAAFAALVSPFIATDGLFGLDDNSYVWRGYGLYTQLWGMVLLPPALAAGYAVLRDGRGYFRALLLLALTSLSHLAFGYMAIASMGLVALLAPSKDGIKRSLLRLILLMAPLGLVTSYFLVPLFLDSAYIARSVWDGQWKYDSYGHGKVLGMLVTGELFDFHRFPSMTILVAIGAIVCVARWEKPHFRVPLALTVLWLLLYFGRPTWGPLLDLMPLSQSFYFHRLISGVHLGAIFLMGMALALPWQLAWTSQRRAALLAPALITALLLWPVYQERAAYLAHNRTLLTGMRDAYAAEQQDVDALVRTIQNGQPGRVYAGLAGTWGAKYRIGEMPLYGLFTQNGHDTLAMLYHVWSLPGDVDVLLDENRWEHYNLFNLRYIVAPADRTFPDFVRFVRQFGKHRLYEVDTTGFFDLVDTTATLVGTKNDFYATASKWLSGPAPAAKEYPILSFAGAPDGQQNTYAMSAAEDVVSTLARADHSPAGQVISTSVDSNTYAARVRVDRPSTLLMKVTYHPNWHAYVDGVETQTLMLMPSFVGVPMTAGIHDVRMVYRPQPLRWHLMLVGLVALVLTAVAERRRATIEAAVARAPRVAFPSMPLWERGWALVTGAVASAAQSLTSTRVWAVFGRPAMQLARGELLTLPIGGSKFPTAWTRVDHRRAGKLRADFAYVVRTEYRYFIGVALIVLLGALPMFQFRLMSGHDYLEYLPRNVEFFRALTNGQPIPQWAPDFSGGYGEPFFAFNPPLIYVVSALFHAVGFSFIAAENLACITLLLLAGLAMYLFARDFLGPRGALVAATAFVFAPYLHSRLYVSHALADYSAFPFVPLAYWGIYRFAEGGRRRFFVVAALSVTALLLSSNPVSLVVAPTLALLTAILAWRMWNPWVAIRGAWCVAVGLGVAAFFWLPAMVEKDLVHTHRLLETFLNYNNHFAYAFQLIHSPWGYGLSMPGPNDGMSFAIGPAHLAMALLAVVLYRRVSSISARTALLTGFCLVIVAIGACLSVVESAFIWDRLPLLQYLEYPWRFHVLAAAGTAFLFGLPLLLIPHERSTLANMVMLGLMVGVLAFNFEHARPEKMTEVTDAEFTPELIASRWLAPTTALEYEPIWVRERPTSPAAEPATLIAGQGRVTVVKRTPPESEFRVETNGEARLQINTFYFPSWKVEVNGRERLIDRSSAQGVMQLSLDAGVHEVRLHLGTTPIRVFSGVLSILAIVLFVATLGLSHRVVALRRKRRRRAAGRRSPVHLGVLLASGVEISKGELP